MQKIVRNSFCNKEFSKFIDVLRKFDRDDVSEYVSGLISNAAVRYLEELFGDQVTLYVISYRKEKRGSGYIVSNTKTKILHISRDGTDITDITYAVSLACELKISKQFRWITQCCFADIQQAIRLHCCKCAVTMKFVLESK